MDLVILSLILVILLWSLMFVFYKKITGMTDYKTLMILKLIFVAVFGLILSILYLVFNKKERLEIIRTDKKTMNYIMITAFIEMLTTFLYIYLMYTKDANWLISILEAGIIITTVILSVLLLKEKISIDRIIGIIVIISGIIIIYRS